MSKLTLAKSLADEFGVSVAQAQRWVDQLGSDVASSLDDAGGGGLSRWDKAGLAAGGGGAGALAWRQQDVWQAQAAAKQASNRSEMVRLVMDSQMSPKAKRQLVGQMTRSPPGRNREPKKGGILSGLLGGDAQTTLVLVVVLALVLAVAGGGE